MLSNSDPEEQKSNWQGRTYARIICFLGCLSRSHSWTFFFFFCNSSPNEMQLNAGASCWGEPISPWDSPAAAALPLLPVPELAFFPPIQFIWAAPVRILLFESSGGSWEKTELPAHPGISKTQHLFRCKVTKFFLGFCLEETSDLLLCLR